MKLFKSYSEKEVKKVRPIVDKINSLEEEISKLSDQELTKKTAYFSKNKKALITQNLHYFLNTTNLLKI